MNHKLRGNRQYQNEQAKKTNNYDEETSSPLSAQSDETREARQLIADLESFGWIKFDDRFATQRKTCENLFTQRLKEIVAAANKEKEGDTKRLDWREAHPEVHFDFHQFRLEWHEERKKRFPNGHWSRRFGRKDFTNAFSTLRSAIDSAMGSAGHSAVEAGATKGGH